MLGGHHAAIVSIRSVALLRNVIGAVRVWPQVRLCPQVAPPPSRAAGHPQGRNEVKEPRSDLTRWPTAWCGSAKLTSRHDTLSPMLAQTFAILGSVVAMLRLLE